MKKFLTPIFLLYTFTGFAQNVGIGTNTPGFPLSFSNALGNKISLYGTTGNHYGFGIQGGLLQMYSDAAAANIAFGYGSSTSFAERMRIVNNGEYGLHVNGRMLLRNGTNPLNTAYGPGIWLTRADNSASLGFMGVQNNQNMGFYGGPAGWGFTYDAVNSRVGIGNQNPNAPLSFPAQLGRKITFYPGTIGNAGISVHGNELRIHSDNPNADISFGHENTGGTFNEQFRFNGNGALVVNGNSGNPGQVLQSNGASASPTWVNPTTGPRPYVASWSQTGNTAFGANLEVVIEGLSNVFNVVQTSTLIFQGQLNLLNAQPTFTGFGYTEVQILDAANNIIASSRSTAAMAALRKTSMSPVGSIVVGAGVYTARAIIGRLNIADLHNASFCEAPSQLIVQIIPH